MPGAMPSPAPPTLVPTVPTLPVGLVYDTAYELHAPPTTGKQHGHIEVPERVSVIYAALGKARLLDKMERVPARCVTRAEAEACHTAEHCDALEALAEAAPQMAGAWAGTATAARETGGHGSAAGASKTSRNTGWLRTGGDPSLGLAGRMHRSHAPPPHHPPPFTHTHCWGCPWPVGASFTRFSTPPLRPSLHTTPSNVAVPVLGRRLRHPTLSHTR
jgi:hypothetical protein